ncbi:MAG: hypothetical protein LBP85_09960 [Prevotellaceae bacterium]|jgi:hypothetical protein|nr:hypothetical protein [Prevotellaceae bacterium]
MTVKELKEVLMHFEDNDIITIIADWDNMKNGPFEITDYGIIEPEVTVCTFTDDTSITEIYFSIIFL